jgi:ribonuclease P protein component
MKSGRKVAAEHLVVYLKRDEVSPQSRFGFLVSKAVGGAVQRNLVKRRLRAVARERLGGMASGTQIVVRALPGAAQITWNKLREELLTAIETAESKRTKS